MMRAGRPNSKNQDANNSMSSDEEMFQECESGFDLDTTATNVEPVTVPAHSSNIDHNVFDKTINFSTIAANSTAGLMASLTTNSSQVDEKSDTLFKTGVADHTAIISQTFEPFALNQTIEMVECGPIDEIASHKNAVEIDARPEQCVVQNETTSMNITKDLNDVLTSTFELNQHIDSSSSNETNVTAPAQANVTIDGLEEHVEQNSPTNEVTSSTEVEVQPKPCELQNESIPINAAQNLNDMPTSTADLNLTTGLSNSSENGMSPIELNSANDTFAKDGSDEIAPQMNVTMDVPMEIEAHNSPMFGNSQPEQSSLQNQTMSMEITQGVNEVAIETTEFNKTMDFSMPKENVTSQMNVTIDAPVENAESNPFVNEVTSSIKVDTQIEQFPLQNRTIPMNVTQDLNDLPMNAAAMNQTIVLSNSKENIVTSPIPLNETFAKNDSPAAFNVTRNVNNDLLSSTRRSIDAIGTDPTSSSHAINLNETIIVDNKLPCMNTSFIVPPKSVEMQSKPNNVNEEILSTPNFDPFKMPAVPANNASNPFDAKQKMQGFDIADDEFDSPGCKFLCL